MYNHISSISKYNYITSDSKLSFKFVKTPLALDPSRITSDAILLYSYMLNRVSLSLRNGMVDQYGRVFIVYSMEEITLKFGKSRNKAVKMVAELESAGLIERTSGGPGKPRHIYVKEFKDDDSDTSDNQSPQSRQRKKPECAANDSDFKKYSTCDNYTPDTGVMSTGSEKVFSTGSKFKPVETPQDTTQSSDSEPVTACHDDSVCSDSEPAEVEKMSTIKNNNIKTYSLTTEVSNHSFIPEKTDTKERTDLPPLASKEETRDRLTNQLGARLMTVMTANNPALRRFVDTALDLLTDTFCSRRKSVRIAREDMPACQVRDVFSRLTLDHLIEVFNNLRFADGEIKNYKSYMLTSLYNVVFSMPVHDAFSDALLAGCTG